MFPRRFGRLSESRRGEVPFFSSFGRPPVRYEMFGGIFLFGYYTRSMHTAHRRQSTNRQSRKKLRGGVWINTKSQRRILKTVKRQPKEEFEDARWAGECVFKKITGTRAAAVPAGRAFIWAGKSYAVLPVIGHLERRIAYLEAQIGSSYKKKDSEPSAKTGYIPEFAASPHAEPSATTGSIPQSNASPHADP